MRHQRLGRVRSLTAMSIFDIAILAVLFISVAFGFYRGSVSSLLGLAACLLSVVAAFYIGPQLASALSANQGVTEMLATYTDATSLVGDYALANTLVSGMSDALIQTVLKSVSLPDSIAAILRSNLSGAVFASAGMNTVNDYVAYTIVAVVLQSFSFVLCYFVCFVLLHGIVALIGHIFYFPVLKHFDGLAGGIYGLLRGVIVLYVLCLMVPVIRTIIPVDLLSRYLGESVLSPIFVSDGFFARIVTGL